MSAKQNQITPLMEKRILPAPSSILERGFCHALILQFQKKVKISSKTIRTPVLRQSRDVCWINHKALSQPIILCTLKMIFFEMFWKNQQSFIFPFHSFSGSSLSIKIMFNHQTLSTSHLWEEIEYKRKFLRKSAL